MPVQEQKNTGWALGPPQPQPEQDKVKEAGKTWLLRVLPWRQQLIAVVRERKILTKDEGRTLAKALSDLSPILLQMSSPRKSNQLKNE